MALSERSQIFIVWWALALAGIFGVTLIFLFHMVPPPYATLTAEQIRDWYLSRDTEIKIGATLAGYAGGCMLPLWAVIAMQIHRQERGRPIWTTMAALGGAMMSLFLVIPSLCFGVAAYTPGRSADATAIMHEFGVLSLLTTDQYFIFNWAAVIAVCFMTQRAPHSPFPRWFGYFTIWVGVMLEAGALAFNFRTGPFAWDGLLVFWLPILLFSLWTGIMSYLLLTRLSRQRADAMSSPELITTPATHAA